MTISPLGRPFDLGESKLQCSFYQQQQQQQQHLEAQQQEHEDDEGQQQQQDQQQQQEEEIPSQVSSKDEPSLSLSHDYEDDDDEHDAMGDSSMSCLEGGGFHTRLDLDTPTIARLNNRRDRNDDAFGPDAPSSRNLMMMDESKRSIAPWQPAEDTTTSKRHSSSIPQFSLFQPAPSNKNKNNHLHKNINNLNKSMKDGSFSSCPSEDDTHVLHDDERSDSEGNDGTYFDEDWAKEMALQKSILITVAGASGMRYLMPQVTRAFRLVLGPILRTTRGSPEEVLVDDPVSTDPAVFQKMVEQISVEAAHNGASSVATGIAPTTTTTTTATSLATTTMAVASSSSTASSMTSSMMLILAVTAAAWAVLYDDSPAVVLYDNHTNPAHELYTNVCGEHLEESVHDVKQGHVRFGLLLTNADFVLEHNQSQLEDIFEAVYWNITGGCAGPYERLLQSVQILSNDYEDEDIENDSRNKMTTNYTSSSSNASSVTTVYTSWMALVSCNGCLDYEPLFASDQEEDEEEDEPVAVVVDATTATAQQQQQESSRSMIPQPLAYYARSSVGLFTRRGRQLEDTTNATADMSTTTNLSPDTANNSTSALKKSLFRRFVTTFGAELSRTMRDSLHPHSRVHVFYGAALSPEGELIEEVTLIDKSLASSGDRQIETPITLTPTLMPTTRNLTTIPTQAPTPEPTPEPTTSPTQMPTPSPTPEPTTSPSTPQPTTEPTTRPTTPQPTTEPTTRPSTQVPTTRPTSEPTMSPTIAATSAPRHPQMSKSQSTSKSKSKSSSKSSRSMHSSSRSTRGPTTRPTTQVPTSPPPSSKSQSKSSKFMSMHSSKSKKQSSLDSSSSSRSKSSQDSIKGSSSKKSTESGSRSKSTPGSSKGSSSKKFTESSGSHSQSTKKSKGKNDSVKGNNMMKGMR